MLVMEKISDHISEMLIAVNQIICKFDLLNEPTNQTKTQEIAINAIRIVKGFLSSSFILIILLPIAAFFEIPKNLPPFTHP